MTKHRIQQELKIILGFVGFLWLVYLVDRIVPAEFAAWGLYPRSISGLLGIVTMPFIHGSFSHLIGNTLPLIVLLTLMAGSRANSFATTIMIAALGGSLLWLIGRNSIHVGASGLIYGLISFLICAGYFEKRPIAIVVAIFVFLIYGTTLLLGVLPSVASHISWEGHLTGAIAGGIVAFAESKTLKKMHLEELSDL